MGIRIPIYQGFQDNSTYRMLRSGLDDDKGLFPEKEKEYPIKNLSQNMDISNRSFGEPLQRLTYEEELRVENVFGKSNKENRLKMVMLFKDNECTSKNTNVLLTITEHMTLKELLEP